MRDTITTSMRIEKVTNEPDYNFNSCYASIRSKKPRVSKPNKYPLLTNNVRDSSLGKIEYPEFIELSSRCSKNSETSYFPKSTSSSRSYSTEMCSETQVCTANDIINSQKQIALQGISNERTNLNDNSESILNEVDVSTNNQLSESTCNDKPEDISSIEIADAKGEIQPPIANQHVSPVQDTQDKECYASINDLDCHYVHTKFRRNEMRLRQGLHLNFIVNRKETDSKNLKKNILSSTNMTESKAPISSEETGAVHYPVINSISFHSEYLSEDGTLESCQTASDIEFTNSCDSVETSRDSICQATICNDYVNDHNDDSGEQDTEPRLSIHVSKFPELVTHL